MMRHRRDVLRSGAGLAALSLAGCVEQDQPGGGPPSEDDDDEQGDAETPPPEDQEGDAGNETGDGEAEDGGGTTGPAFEVASTQMPESPEIGSPAEFRVTVVNTGDADGRFTTPVSARAEDGEWRRIGAIDLQVRAGGEGIYRGAVTAEHLGRYQIRFDDLGRTYEFQTSPGQLDYGQSYRTPNDVVVTVEDVMLRQSYPYFEGDDRKLEYARRNRRFAIAVVTARNDSAYVRRAPSPEGMILVADGDQYDPIELDHDLAPVTVDRKREMTEYTGGRTYTGVTKRGLVFYDVPDTVQANTPTKISMNEGYDGGRVSVTWQGD